MAHRRDVIENPVTGERITFLQTSRDTGGESLQLNWSLEPDGSLPGAHTHPHQQECFEVLSGTLGVRVGRRKYRLGAGGVMMVPAGAVHTLDTESVLQTIFGLARDGKVSKRGAPGLLQIIALLDEYEDELGIPWVPKRVQHAIVSRLAPLARGRGYRGRYPEYSDQQHLIHPTSSKEGVPSEEVRPSPTSEGLW